MKRLFITLLSLSVGYCSQAQPWASLAEDYTPGSGSTFYWEAAGYGYGGLNTGIFGAAGSIYFNKFHLGTGHHDPYRYDGVSSSQVQEFGDGGTTKGYYGYNGKAYFLYEQYYVGGLYVTDGTSAGTHMIKKIPMETFNYSPISNIVQLNGKMYFIQHQLNVGGVVGAQETLWESDGTDAGTKAVKVINTPPNNILDAMVFDLRTDGNKIRFRISSEPMQQHWVSDGTAAGTVQVLNGWEDPLAYNGNSYFVSRTGTGSALYSTNGTQAGTTLIKQLHTGTTPALADTLRYMAEVNGKMVFTTVDDQDKTYLWASDGSAGGTLPIAQYQGDSTLGKMLFVVLNNKLFYSIKYTGAFGAYYPTWYLGVTDGTTAGTHVVDGNFSLGSGPIEYYPHIVHYGKLFFPHLGMNIFEGYRFDAINYTDGTVAGTGKVGGDVQILTNVAPIFDTAGGVLYFPGVTAAAGHELWRIDDFPLSVATVQAAAKDILYPNPVTHSFNVQTEDAANTSVSIYNLTGQLLLHTQQTRDIDVQALPAGVYSVRIACRGTVQTVKLLKE